MKMFELYVKVNICVTEISKCFAGFCEDNNPKVKLFVNHYAITNTDSKS